MTTLNAEQKEALLAFYRKHLSSKGYAETQVGKAYKAFSDFLEAYNTEADKVIEEI